ncbi:MAG: hypothetical protein Ta2E_07710 [Mycoplasmoidaceae bacterium]|nr:MAG: hypothetical protein Ta2E_07710 [Mycoplasmoidaceae bacterium]
MQRRNNFILLFSACLIMTGGVTLISTSCNKGKGSNYANLQVGEEYIIKSKKDAKSLKTVAIGKSNFEFTQTTNLTADQLNAEAFFIDSTYTILTQDNNDRAATTLYWEITNILCNMVETNKVKEIGFKNIASPNNSFINFDVTPTEYKLSASFINTSKNETINLIFSYIVESNSVKSSSVFTVNGNTESPFTCTSLFYKNIFVE